MRAHRFSNRAVLSILLKSSLSIPVGCRSYTADGREAGGTQGSDWVPTQFVQFSCRLHALGIVVAACVPDSLAYIGVLIALNQVVVSGAGMYPKSTLLGNNMVRLSPAAAARGEVALSFDDGPDPAVTPKVLQVLDQYGLKASFFCIGKRAIACPEIVAETAARGHRVENHSFSHSHAFGFYGVKSLASDIHRSQEALEKITGCRPSLLRAPAGIRNLWLDPVLTQLDLTLVSWTRRGFDTVCRQPQTITQRLIQGLAAGDILLLHDGSSRRDVHGRPVVLEVLPRLIEAIAAKGLTPVPIA